MCSAFTPIVAMAIALLFSLGTCIVQIQSVQVDFACTKRLFDLLAEGIINVRNMVCMPGALYSFWRSNNILFLVAWSRGLHFWREPKIRSRCYWKCPLSWQVLFQQREWLIYWRLCNNPRSIYACGKCGAWLFVHKVSFMLQEHAKTTKTEETRFSLLEKLNLVPNKPLLLNVPFQSTNYRKKELCVDSKVRETIGDVYCPTSRIEKSV